MNHLYVLVKNPSLVSHYFKNRTTYLESQNLGFDIIFPHAGAKQLQNLGAPRYYAEDVKWDTHNTLIDLEVVVALKDCFGFKGYWLVPRSSTAKYGLRLANSIGIIDPNYRGINDTLKVALDIQVNERNLAGFRLFQVVDPAGQRFDNITIIQNEFSWKRVTDIESRGGFGSTGN